MAANRRYESAKRLPVASAHAAIASGDLVVQEGLFGIALTSAAITRSLWIACEGGFEIPVPSGTVKGDILSVASLADAVNPTLVRTAHTGRFKIGVAISDRDAALKAIVILAPQGPAAIA